RVDAARPGPRGAQPPDAVRIETSLDGNVPWHENADRGGVPPDAKTDLLAVPGELCEVVHHRSEVEPVVVLQIDEGRRPVPDGPVASWAEIEDGGDEESRHEDEPGEDQRARAAPERSDEQAESQDDRGQSQVVPGSWIDRDRGEIEHG